MTERKLIIYPGIDLDRVNVVNEIYERTHYDDLVGRSSIALFQNENGGVPDVVVYQTKTARVFRPNGDDICLY